MYSRQELEEIEDRSLAPYGVRSKDSKGRAYLDDEPDYRFEGNFFRTRLTHTE